MPKFIFTILLSLFMLSYGCSPKTDNTKNTDKSNVRQTDTTKKANNSQVTTTTSTTKGKIVSSGPKKDYTFMVYCIGSDLESGGGYTSLDLTEMMEVGSGKSLNIVAQTGGAKKWKNKAISNKNLQRWLIEKGKLKKLQDLDNNNMVQTSGLTDFIKWTVQNYPADKYVLTFWNHGGGTLGGYGYDEVSDAMFSLNDIQTSLADAKTAGVPKFELIGFDACLMASVETVKVIEPFAKYFVASEEVEPGHGWDYTKIMKAITDDSSITGDAVGKVIADGFKAQAEDEGTECNITLSVIDLSKVGAMMKELDVITKKINTDIAQPQKFKKIANARSKSEDYGNSSDSWTDLVDVGALASKIEMVYPTETKSLLTKLNAAVLYKVNGEGRRDSHGLSVYFPFKDKENFKDNLEAYKSINFSNEYKAFVGNYVARSSGKTTPLSINFTNKTPKAKGKSFDVYVNPKDVDNINRIYSVMVEKKGSDTLIIGMDADVVVSADTGRLYDNFTGKWLTLGGEPVSMFLENEGSDYAVYSIPMKLNNVKCDLMVYRSFQTNEYKILGAWKGVDPKTKMADKNIIKIKPNDKIIFLYYSYTDNLAKASFVSGKNEVSGANLKFKETKLKKGKYLYGFYIIDNAQNKYNSDFIEVTVKK